MLCSSLIVFVIYRVETQRTGNAQTPHSVTSSCLSVLLLVKALQLDAGVDFSGYNQINLPFLLGWLD